VFLKHYIDKIYLYGNAGRAELPQVYNREATFEWFVVVIF
jgi:hypothetical protein